LDVLPYISMLIFILALVMLGELMRLKRQMKFIVKQIEKLKNQVKSLKEEMLNN
tara:strand:- start:24 stop:185 length:162 start_codon:yes stop_codon:yes gene_type:complete